MQQEPFSLEAAIIAVTIIFLVLGAFIVMIMLVFRKRRNTHIIEKINIQSQFRQELLKTQIEMQEQTLAHISREIHDNVTQVLSFVKLNLAMIVNADELHKNESINESRELIAQAITDLRDISKSLSFEHIAQFGLIGAIEIELQRIKKSGIITTEIVVDGNVYPLGEQRELVLFRIFQESLNNTLKHSGAKQFKIGLQYAPEMFTLTLEDNGKGFSVNSPGNKRGAGLRNIKNRATLIGAAANIDRLPGKGCVTKIHLSPLEHRLHDGTHHDRFS